MAGLLGDVLPYIYQRANALKRGIGDFVSDPMGSIAQGVNYANDRAGGLLEATRAASEESAAGGGLMYGPANKKLAGILANAYNPMGITVYHGSPHKFTKLDSSKIGTGEGAQAYGDGLYFAESPDVAKSYQTALSADRGFSFGGKDGLTRAEVQDLVNTKYGNGYLDGVTRPSGVADSFMDDMVTGTLRAEGTIPRQYKPGSERARVYNELRGQITHTDPGSLYKVDLPDSAVARMLDWDKPLSQQPQNVRDSLDALRQANPQGYQRLVDAQLGGPLMEQAAGMDLYRNLIKGANERQMVEVMRQQGIPGIRYLDGGSRGAGTGTSNFVVFPGEESLLTILERNGMPLPK